MGAAIGCAVGYVAGGYVAEYGAETLERWGLDISLGTTRDGIQISGSDHRRVGEPVDDYIRSNPDGQARGSQNLDRLGFKSLARHTAIHRWYAQSSHLKGDMSDFMRDRNPLVSAVSITNTTDKPLTYTFNWDGRQAETFELSQGSTRRHWIQRLDATSHISFSQNGAQTRYRLTGFLTANYPPATEDTRNYRFVERNNAIDLFATPLRPDVARRTRMQRFVLRIARDFQLSMLTCPL